MQRRTSKIPVLPERTYHAKDVQQLLEKVKAKLIVKSKLDLAKQFVKIGLPSSADKCIERWSANHPMQEGRRQATETKREIRSRNPPQK